MLHCQYKGRFLDGIEKVVLLLEMLKALTIMVSLLIDQRTLWTFGCICREVVKHVKMKTTPR